MSWPDLVSIRNRTPAVPRRLTGTKALAGDRNRNSLRTASATFPPMPALLTTPHQFSPEIAPHSRFRIGEKPYPTLSCKEDIMKTVMGILVLIICCGAAYSQTPDWLWAQRAGEASAPAINNQNTGNSIVKDGSGNSYVTGSFQGNATFGTTTLTSAGSGDVFIAKLNANGEWLWAIQAGGTGSDIGYGIILGGSYLYVTGAFQNTASFGATTLTSSGGYDMFLAKLSTDGVWSWKRRAGGTGDDWGNDVAYTTVGSTGYCYITGEFRGTSDFGSYSLTGYGTSSDIFITKLDYNGSWYWATRWGDARNDSGAGIAADASGNCYISGTQGPNPPPWVFHFSLVTGKVNSSGTWQWSNSNGGYADSMTGSDVTLDTSGYCYVAGDFFGTQTLGSSTITSSGWDAFIGKLSPSGVWQWARSGGGTGNDHAQAISYDGTYLYLTGSFSNTASFGSQSLSSAGGDDIWLGKMSSAGSWQWASRAGSSGADYGYGIAGEIAVTGQFGGTADFGATTLNVNGSSAMFAGNLTSGGSWNWATCCHYTGFPQAANDIAADSGGNSYVTGTFENSVQFGSFVLTESLSGADEYLVKHDASGNAVWAQSSSQSGHDCGYWRVAVDGNGNSYVVGGYDSVSKWDTNGNWLWSADFGISSTLLDFISVSDIAVDASGNCYITGLFHGDCYFGAIDLYSYQQNIFVAKVNTSGTWQWAIMAALDNFTSDNAAGNALSITNSGQIFVTGAFSGTPLFGSVTLTATGGSDIILAKVSASGGWDWVTGISAPGAESGQAIRFAGNGNIWLKGRFDNSLSLGSTTLTTSGGTDTFIAKRSSYSGTWLWAKQAGGSGNDNLGASGSMAIGSDGSCLISGSYNGIITCGPTVLTSSGDDDICVAKLDANGNWLWAASIGGGGEDQSAGIAMDGNANGYLAGCFHNTVSFGATPLTSIGDFDICLAKVQGMVGSGIPLAPQNLTITRSGNNINLQWSPVTQDTDGYPLIPDYYKIYSCTTGPNGAFNQIATNITGTSWTQVNGANPGMKFYRVVAVNE